MKLQKYVFLMSAANEMACKRLGCPVLKPSDQFALYSINYVPKATHSSLMRHAESMKYSIAEVTLSKSLALLLESDLVSLSARVYSITWRGREYFSYIRRYLLHKRLS